MQGGNYMLRREWGKVLIFSLIGLLLIGGAIVYNRGYGLPVCDIAALLIVSPVYGVGLIYGMGAFFNMLGAILKWVGGMLFMHGMMSSGCGFSGCFDWIVRFFLMALLIWVIASVGWLVGLWSAAKKLKEAEETDMQFMV